MFCALLIPDYRLQAVLRYRMELWRQPVAVVESNAIVELTPAAADTGVCVGMSPSQALARCLELEVLSRVPAAERSVAETLLGIACSASAYVEQTAENVCTLDLQGCREKDLAAWGRALVNRLASLQLRMQLGIAENPDLALLAAQSANSAEPVRMVSNSAAFLTGLPLTVLAPPPAIASVLQEWGITTLGGLTRLKTADVAARLGGDGVRLWEQGCGHSMRLLRLVRPPDCYEEAFDFERELETAQPLLFLLRRFVDQLARRLETVGLVAAELRLALPLSGGSHYERVFRIPSPTANADVLFRILDTHFENLRLDHPPTGVRLTAEPTKPEHQQFRLFENAVRDPNRFAETLARIMVVVGNGNVGVPERKPTHKPDQFVLTAEGATGTGNFSKTPAIGLPLRRFRPPLPAQVHAVPVNGSARMERPQYVVSEQAHGTVVDVLGPYRISGEWWQEGWSTEEWDVQMADGSLYRLSRHGEEWQVEGCYD